jgi:hypothetical protein
MTSVAATYEPATHENNATERSGRISDVSMSGRAGYVASTAVLMVMNAFTRRTRISGRA